MPFSGMDMLEAHVRGVRAGVEQGVVRGQALADAGLLQRLQRLRVLFAVVVLAMGMSFVAQRSLLGGEGDGLSGSLVGAKWGGSLCMPDLRSP